MREVWYCATEDKRLEKTEIVKGYEYEKNKYIVVEPEDLEKNSTSDCNGYGNSPVCPDGGD